MMSVCLLFREKLDWLLSLTLFSAIFLFYAWCTSDTVLLEDDGGFILTAVNAGVSHPPGYPAFNLIGYLFSLIPVGTEAYRVHIMSAFFGAGTCLIVFLLIRAVGGRYFAAMIGGLVLALSEVFWSQSIIAEVYTLNSFLCLLCLLLLVRILKDDDPLGDSAAYLWFLVSFCYGLALTNHWPLVVLTTPGMIVLFYPFRVVLFKRYALILAGLLLGLIPYFWMYWRASTSSEYVFAGGVDTLNDFFYYLSRKGYSNVDVSPTATWYDKLQFICYFIFEFCSQVLFIGIVFAVLGCLFLIRRDKRLLISLCVAIFGNSLFLIALLNFDYANFDKIIFKVYPLFTYSLLAVLTGLGVHWLICLFSDKFRQVIIYIFCIVFVICLGVVNMVGNNHRHTDWAEAYATGLLEVLPRNAILIVDGDVNSGPLGYVHWLKGVRSDVILYQRDALLYPNALFHPYKTPTDERNAGWLNLIEHSERPVFATSLLPIEAKVKDYGVFFAYSANSGQFIVDSEKLSSWYLSLLDRLAPVSTDMLWERVHKEIVATRLVVYFDAIGKIASLNESQFSNMTAYLESKVMLLQLLNAQDAPSYIVDPLVTSVTLGLHDALSKEAQAAAYHAISSYYFKRGDQELAWTSLLASGKSWPSLENPAIKVLAEEAYLRQEMGVLKWLEETFNIVAAH